MLGKRVKAIAKDADYMIELKKSRVRRTNQGGNAGCHLCASSMKHKLKDALYVAYLEDLEDIAEVGIFEEDLDDPGYVIALDYLKEVGDSYVLKKSTENGVFTPIMYELEDIDSEEAGRRSSPQFGQRNYRRERQFNGIRKNRMSRGVRCTQKERTRKNSRHLRNRSIRKNTISDRNFDMSNSKKDLRSQGASSKQQKRTAGESVKKKGLLSDSSIEEALLSSDSSEYNMYGLRDRDYSPKEKSFDKISKRKLRSCGVNNTLKERNSKNSCDMRNRSIQKNTISDRNFDMSNRQKDLRSCGASSKQQGRTAGESMKKKCKLSDGYTQAVLISSDSSEDNMYGLRDYSPKEMSFNEISQSKLRSSGANNSLKERNRDESVKRKQSLQIHEMTTSNSSEDNGSVSKDLDFYNKMMDAAYEEVQEKETIGKVNKRRKLTSYSATQEPMSLNINKNYFGEGSSDRRLMVVPDPMPIRAVPASLDLCDKVTIAAYSSILHISDAPASCGTPKREIVLGLPLKGSTLNERLPPLPPTVRVATQSQPAYPLRLSLPDSSLTMTPLDMEVAAPIMRKKLVKILSKPYSKEEHDRLWNELSFRSPVLIHRDSRSGGSHRPGNMGRSLLDWNPDVQSEIEKVKSYPNKVLNLLRMLAFYIEKRPNGNICKPWMDESMKAILPGSS